MNVALHARRVDILSLCTGGGGLDLGLELALPGARAVCVVEREAFAVSHLVAAMRAGLMAEAPIWSDARTFDGRAWRGCVDWLIGGIPCQPHSLAGKRLAEEDERDLWSTARLIIVQSRPRCVLIENVGGMLSSGGAERVWRDLRRLGYAVEIGLFTASEVGASHERERLFILAVADASIWTAQRRGGAGDMVRPGRNAEVETWERQWGGDTIGNRGEGMADAAGVGASPRVSRQERPEQGGLAGKSHHDSNSLVDAQGVGRREGRPEHELRRGRPASAIAGNIMVDAVDRGHDGVEDVAIGGAIWGTPIEWPERIALFPPGPHDSQNWKAILDRAPELEPAFRRVADGLASRLDFARVDRLRLLGNGVVPLEAAYAIRTLATRLARRSAGAAELVLMMGETP